MSGGPFVFVDSDPWLGLGREDSQTAHDDIYKNDSLRLLSFSNWKNPNVSRSLLVTAGFYYVDNVRGRPGDTVRCAWCGRELNNWTANQCPIKRHILASPECSFALKLAYCLTPRLANRKATDPQTCNEILLRHSEIELSELGITAHKPPFQVKYSSLDSRMSTFSNWPKGHSQKPDAMAQAGFYYCGINDEVRCFHCDICLRLWEPSDNPWVEHAKHSIECGFLLLVKGRKFVELCNKNISIARNSNSERVEGNTTNSPPRTITDSDIENYMSSPCALVALQCGLQPDRIRSAIRKRLQLTGIPYNSSTNLISAALNEQVNETPFSIPESIFNESRASSSSIRYPINYAAIDQVTRTIIRSALMEENFESPVPQSNDFSEEDTTDDEDSNAAISSANSVAARVDSPKLNKSTIGENKKDEKESNVVTDNPPNLGSQKDKSNASNKESSLEDENKKLREARTCKICLDAEVNVVFLPCGHLVSCNLCATGLMQCPICRGIVKGFVRAYLS